ncbi:MAG: GAF domain-containing protein [Aliidongia sp.]
MPPARRAAPRPLSWRPERTTGRLPSLHAGALDTATATKLTTAISSELLLEPLIARLLDLAMENAGARFAALILAEGGELTVPAEHQVDAEDRPFVLDRPLSATDLPAAVIHYVSHTGETIMLEDAGASLQFGHAARWADGVPRSVLCLPIMDRGQFTGALYLENDLATGTFTQERVEPLRVLAGQAAIAIANARSSPSSTRRGPRSNTRTTRWRTPIEAWSSRSPNAPPTSRPRCKGWAKPISSWSAWPITTC